MKPIQIEGELLSVSPEQSKKMFVPQLLLRFVTPDWWNRFTT